MIAVIDVSEKQKEFVYSLPKKHIKEAAGSGALLLSLDELLKEEGQTIQDIEGVVVVLGQGRFTSTRSAIILANSFAYARQIPIVSVQKTDLDDEEKVRNLLKKNGLQYLLPSYYAPPNITQKKT